MKLLKCSVISCIFLIISITSVFADTAGIVYEIENRKEGSSNFWKDYADGIALKDSKNYSAAVSKLEIVAPNFLKENNHANMALLFSNIGECYANLKEYDKASECWIREGYYWEKAGKSQETIAAIRKSDNIKSEVILYSNTRDESKSLVKYFDAPLEPKLGILLGAYAEMDKAVHDSSSADKFYINEFPKLAGKDHAAYLIYLTYGMDLSSYHSHINVAKEKNKIIELALQPIKGLDSVNDKDGYLVKLAKDMENSGAKFMLRFANEMNDQTSLWYTADYNKYISKFRMVSKIFKENAPSAAIVWAPNFFPPDTIPSYYPGDEYVDYVGISSYQNYAPNLDPLKQGVDRSRWSSQLDRIYSLYGDRKPIVIAEGGVSYIARSTGENITNYASKQLKDFYTYLPIKYPNVKAVFLYGATNLPSKYILSENPTMLNTYSQAIKNNYYLSDYKNSSVIDTYYYPISGNKISPTLQELCSYIKYAEDTKIARVEYKVNNETVGNTYEIPYKVNCDFSKYGGQTVVITVNTYDSNSNLLVTKKFKAMVE